MSARPTTEPDRVLSPARSTSFGIKGRQTFSSLAFKGGLTDLKTNEVRDVGLVDRTVQKRLTCITRAVTFENPVTDRPWHDGRSQRDHYSSHAQEIGDVMPQNAAPGKQKWKPYRASIQHCLQQIFL
jgi:hypothetical protein